MVNAAKEDDMTREQRPSVLEHSVAEMRADKRAVFSCVDAAHHAPALPPSLPCREFGNGSPKDQQFAHTGQAGAGPGRDVYAVERMGSAHR